MKKSRIKINEQLERVYKQVNELAQNDTDAQVRVPEEFYELAVRWSYGTTGWTSPLNILITASWYKWLYPQQDVCIIWSKNGEGLPIPGGFSVRTYDEKYTVPLVAKYELYKGFCSNNSGMQGARSLEKARGVGRINVDGAINQDVRFDLKLFARTLNTINSYDSLTALSVFRFYILKAIRVRDARRLQLSSIKGLTYSGDKDTWFIVERAIQEAADPQFIKTVVAACLYSCARYANYTVHGLDAPLTGADARSGGPGDLFLSKDDTPLVGVEVKDASRQIGFTTLSAIRERITNNKLSHYLVVVASSHPLQDQVRDDPDWYGQLNEIRKTGCAVTVMSLEQLWNMSSTFTKPTELIDRVSQYLPLTASLKPTTAQIWFNSVSSD